MVEGYEPEPEFYGAIRKGRRGGKKEEPRREKESSRRESREKRPRRDDERREPRRVEPAKPKLPKLDFDPSKPYESRVSSGETAAPEPKRSHHRPKRPVPALLGGLPKTEPEK